MYMYMCMCMYVYPVHNDMSLGYFLLVLKLSFCGYVIMEILFIIIVGSD